jgi:hypothetical protein
MRELILQKLEQYIINGDYEITDEYGDIETIKAMSDVELLEVYKFAVGFRG